MTERDDRAALDAIERALEADDPGLASALARFAPRRSPSEVLRSLLWSALVGAGAAFAALGQMSSTYAALSRSLPDALRVTG